MTTPRNNAAIDQNWKPTLTAVSTTDGQTPVTLEADPGTGALLVSSSGGGGSGAITSVIPGTGPTNLGKADDSPMVTGDVGVMALAVANEAQVNLTDTDGDYTPIGVDRAGRQYSKITDGTNVVNVLKSDGTAAGQNAEIVSGTGMTTATITLNSGTPNTAWFDMLNYAWVSVEILTNTTPATLSFQASGDASQTVATGMNMVTSNGNTVISSTTVASGNFHGARTGRYFRVASNNGAGTTTLVITFYTVASAATSVLVAPGAGSLSVVAGNATGSAVPANAFYIGVGGSAGNLSGVQAPVNIGDGNSLSSSLTTGGYAYNTTNWDRMRNNTTGALIAAGTTTTQTGITLTTYNAGRLMLLVNVTAGAGSVTVAINGTSSSGYSTNLLTSTALTGTGTTALRVFDGGTPSANLVANDLLPRNISVTATVSGTITYGIDWILGV